MTENAPPPPAAPPPVPAAQVQQFNQVLEVDEVYSPPSPLDSVPFLLRWC